MITFKLICCSAAAMSCTQSCRFGSYAYDNIVLFAPAASLSGEVLNVNTVMEFVQRGGNLIAAAGVSTSKAVRKLAALSGVDFDAAGSVVSCVTVGEQCCCACSVCLQTEAVVTLSSSVILQTAALAIC
jgi:Oligosaccharyltransferase 48 kDa subunit beta